MALVRGTAHPRSVYDEQQRSSALELYREHRLSRIAIAKQIGCSRVTVARWIEEAELDAGWRLERSLTMRRTRPAG